MASMNDMTQVQRNRAGIKTHTITKARWFNTTEISSTPRNWREIAMRSLSADYCLKAGYTAINPFGVFAGLATHGLLLQTVSGRPLLCPQREAVPRLSGRQWLRRPCP